MKKTFKGISAVLTAVMLIMALPSGIAYAADSGAEFYRYFDLQDITNNGSAQTTWPGGSSEPWLWKGTGAQVITDSETGSKVWEFKKNAQVYYTFPESFESGIVRISFDLKATGINVQCFPKIYAGDGKEYLWALFGVPIDGEYVLQINNRGFATGATWGKTLPFTRDEWHRIDIVADYTGSVPLFQTYYDGTPIIDGEGLDISKVGGIKEFRFAAPSSGTSFTEGFILTDNFVFSRFEKNSLMLTNVGDQKIEIENGSIKLYLSERVDKALLTAENVTLTHKKTGETVTNFDITPDENGEYFTISFDGEIPAGRYGLLLDESICGNISGLPMVAPFEVRTEPKMVDGVEIPEISAIRIYDYKGEELLGSNLTSMISKAEIEFNRPIAESGKEKVTVTKGGEPVKCEKEIDGQIMTLSFEKLLEPGGSYVIDVAEGIAAAESENAISEDSDSKSFTTQNDAGVVFFEKNLSDDQETYSFKVVKNTSTALKYTFSVCGYTEQTIGEDILPQLMGMGYKAIDFSENDKGIFDYTISTGFSGCDDVNTFVWNYPSNSSVQLDENGKIKQ